jgi:hypothetical protein
MLFEEIIAVYSGNHAEQIIQNADLFIVETGGTTRL